MRATLIVWGVVAVVAASGCAQLKVVRETENTAHIRVYRSDNWRGRAAEFAEQRCGGADEYKVIRFEQVRGAGGRGGARTAAREMTIVCRRAWIGIEDDEELFTLIERGPTMGEQR